MSKQKNTYLDDEAEQALEKLKKHFSDKSDSEIVQDAIKSYSKERDVDEEIRRRKRRIRDLESEVEDIQRRIEQEKEQMQNARERKRLEKKFQEENEEKRQREIRHQVKDLARVAEEKGWDTAKKAASYRRVTSDDWEYEKISVEKLLNRVHEFLEGGFDE